MRLGIGIDLQEILKNIGGMRPDANLGYSKAYFTGSFYLLEIFCFFIFRNPLTLENQLSIITIVAINVTQSHGGIAQLARAFGSYPTGHRFKSSQRHQHIPRENPCCKIPLFIGDFFIVENSRRFKGKMSKLLSGN